MRRYEHCKVLNRMISAPDGEWVKWEEVKFWLNAITSTLHKDTITPTQACADIAILVDEAREVGE